MAKIYDTIYMDSCVIFDCLTKLPQYFPHVEPILQDAMNEKVIIVASCICFAEVLDIREDPQSNEKIEAFFDQPYVAVYDVDDKISRKAGAIRRNANLETADAIHIATAIIRGAQVFLTRDGDGEKGKKGKRRRSLNCGTI